MRNPLLVDGHVHITNRVHWEGLDPFQPLENGFDFTRARDSGVNVIIENVAPYGYANFNYTPKQALRLIETFHRMIERHADSLGLALTVADARRLVAEGRIAVFLGIEAGFDQEGDPEVLRALYRLGLRVVQFSTQTCFNGYADAELGGRPAWHGINDRGRELVSVMNELGILIDITHATPQAQIELIAASRAPVVASHMALATVSGTAPTTIGLLRDDVLEALAAKGGLVGIIGAASAVSPTYRAWLAANPEAASAAMAPVLGMTEFASTRTRAPLDHGEFGAWLDETMRAHHLAAFASPPSRVPVVPTAHEWAAHAAYVIRTVGPEHAAIGLDLAGPRPAVPGNASGYPDLLAALGQVTTEQNVQAIAGENWLRVLQRTLGG